MRENVRELLMKGIETLDLKGTDEYKVLLKEFETEVIELFSEKAFSGEYVDITTPLDTLDYILSYMEEYEFFYECVLPKEYKLKIEVRAMLETVKEYENYTDYLVGYDKNIPLLIVSEKYYNKYISKYNKEIYQKLKFVRTEEIKERKERLQEVLCGINDDLIEIIEENEEVKLIGIIEEIEDMNNYLTEKSNQEWLVESVLDEFIGSGNFEELILKMCDSINGDDLYFKELPCGVMEFYIENNRLIDELRVLAKNKIKYEYISSSVY